MANSSVTIEAKLNEKGVTSGAKKIKISLEEIKQADGSLNWSGLKDGEKASKQTSDGFTFLKGTLANLAAQGVSMAMGAIKNLATEAIAIGQGFETSMSKVSALSGATGDDLASLEAKARELGAATTFSASEAADALGYMALAGWDTQQMLDGVGSVLTLAQAGELELAAASDLVTDYLSAFNMEAAETSRMVDVLAYAQANANTMVEGLGMAFKNCAANANAAGLDIETTTSLISQMANQGLKGSEAGTALNAVLRDMTAQMEDGAIKIGDHSVAIMDAEGNYRDFIDILSDVEDATFGMGDAEKAAALQSTFTADSIKGLNLLLNTGTETANMFRDELYNCAGAGSEMADIMTDNLGGDLAEMGSAFEELALKVYDGLQVPLRGLVQFITNSVVPALTWLTDHFTYVAIALGAVGSAFIASKIVSNFAQIKSVLAAIPKLLAAVSANPIFIVIGAIAALASGLKWAYDNVQPFHEAIDLLMATLSESFGPVIDQLSSAFSEMLPAAMGVFSTFMDGIVIPAITMLADFIVTYVVPALTQFGIFLQENVIPALSAFAGWVSENVLPILSEIGNFIITYVIPALGELVSWFINNVVPALVEAYNWFSANILPILNTLAAIILAVVVPALAAVGDFIMGTIVPAFANLISTIGGFVDNASNTFNGFLSFVTSVFERIKSAITDPIENAKNTVRNIINTIKGFFDNFHIQLPHINLPHFAINPPGWQIGDLLQGKIPTLGIEWYATGGKFSGPSIIGVGEAGTEFVIPRDGKHMLPFAQAVAQNMDAPSAEEIAELVNADRGGSDPGIALLVEEIRALRQELPALFATFCLRSLSVNKREFARLVEESGAYL